MAEILMLRPVMALPDPYGELLRRRVALLAAWTAWLATAPASGDVDQEIDGTTNAMRSLADLLGQQHQEPLL